VFYCPHGPDEGCRCRKPEPGLFEQISDRFGFGLKDVPTVGDSVRDLIAGVAVGCQPHLVLTGKSAGLRGRTLPETLPAGTQVHIDLAGFVDALLEQEADVS
jgi:D-glycero-D-manno-heptose 1,7-bisphosphate phosphatase